MASNGLNHEQEREVEHLLVTANLQRMRGQLADAEDTCRKVLNIAPKDMKTRELLGDILVECGKLDTALVEYRSALESAPGVPSLEKKFAKVTLDIAERERQKSVARDMLENPRKYTTRARKPGMALLLAMVPGLGQFYNHEFVKGGIIFGAFLLFMLAWAVSIAITPMRSVHSLQEFLYSIPSLVMLLGFLAFAAYVYGLIDAPLTAGKSSKADDKQIGS